MALLKVTEKGIYCSEADVYIDPWKPVQKAIITHAHADHCRKGHTQYLATKNSIPIIKHRLGNVNINGLEYGEKININGVQVSFHPAGHVVGSAQIRVEYKGEIWVASGDYKTQNDNLSQPIEIVPCHAFITESTFGLPVFRWEEQDIVMNQINEWWEKNKAEGKISIISAYSLGKAQRVIQNLNHDIGKIYCHTAIYNTNRAIRNSGIDLKRTEHFNTHTTSKSLIGNLLITPPGTINSKRITSLKPASVAVASGWMAMRGMRRRRSVDKGFVFSDHADWTGLLEVIEATGASEVMVTHGYSEIFSKYLREKGLKAYTEETAFEGENMEEPTPTEAS